MPQQKHMLSLHNLFGIIIFLFNMNKSLGLLRPFNRNMVRMSQKQFSSTPTDIPTTANSKVFFEIQIGNEKAGRIEFELFDNVVPKTAQNFRELCTGVRKCFVSLSFLAPSLPNSVSLPLHRWIWISR